MINGSRLERPCRNCGLMLGLNLSKKPEQTLWEVGIGVCSICLNANRDGDYKKMTMTRAIEDYCLTNTDLSDAKLAVIKKPNPHSKNKFMKLYYKFQVEEIAKIRHGSVNNAFVEASRRRDLRLQSKLDKQYVIPKLKDDSKPKLSKKKKLTTEEVLMKYSIVKEPHIHNFSKPIKLSQGSMMKKCIDCNFEVKWEEI